MAASDAKQGNAGLATSRIEALTDGIFAFAMTLLVLDLQLPDGTPTAGVDLYKLLLGQSDRFFNYFLSFVLLAVFWVVHNQHFHHIKKSDTKLLWINIFLLMFIVLMPFSTSLVGDYDNNTVAEAAFALNMFVIGALFLANWAYATLGFRLVDKTVTRGEHVREGLARSLTIPLVSLIALFLAFVSPGLSPYSYLIIPVFEFGRRFKKK